MNSKWDEFNKYYKKNPPKKILDCDGVKHIIEVPDPAVYEFDECPCGKIHRVEDDTWYHKSIPMNYAGDIGVFRACKECREVLMKRLVK